MYQRYHKIALVVTRVTSLAAAPASLQWPKDIILPWHFGNPRHHQLICTGDIKVFSFSLNLALGKEGPEKRLAMKFFLLFATLLGASLGFTGNLGFHPNVFNKIRSDIPPSPYRPSTFAALIDELLFAEDDAQADKAYIRMKKMISPLKKILEDQLRILKFKVKLNLQKLTQISVQNRTLTQPRIL